MLPAELIKKIRQIEIRTNRIVNESLAGDYHSVFKGRGMEFLEVREYQQGDDIRTIDWNVTARTGHPFVKVYVEERELTIMLIVDTSRSQHFGSYNASKAAISAEISALLAFSAIKNNDKVGLIMYSDKIEKFIPPGKGRKHVLQLIRDILFFEPEGQKTDTANALDFFGKVINKTSVAFLLSDFYDNNFWKSLSISSRKHDMTALRVLDPFEIALPSAGIIEVMDAENGRKMLIDSSDRRFRKEYEQMEFERREEVARQMKTSGVAIIDIRTNEPYHKPLVSYFRQRQAMMK